MGLSIEHRAGAIGFPIISRCGSGSLNIEAGKGRADLICRPKKPGFTAKLIEFKASNNEAEMETLANAALTQIDKKKYAARLRAEGHADFTKLSVVICGKECRVRKA